MFPSQELESPKLNSMCKTRQTALCKWLNGFYQDRVEALRGVIKAKLADSSLYLSSIVLVPSSPSSFITVLVFWTICTIGSFPAHHPCIYLRVQRRNQFSMRLPCYVARFTA
jgi:hypothetical protein